MANYTLYLDNRNNEARSIHEDAEGRKYLRVRENDQNSMVSLGTSSLVKAIKLRDERQAVKTAVKLGMPVRAPQEAARRTKTTASDIIMRYRDDGFPGKRGGKRNPGLHREGEAARCEVLLEYFNGAAAAEDLDQNALDDYHAWRCRKVAEGILKKDGPRSRPRGKAIAPRTWS
jgi:hypothetical protein